MLFKLRELKNDEHSFHLFQLNYNISLFLLLSSFSAYVYILKSNCFKQKFSFEWIILMSVWIACVKYFLENERNFWFEKCLFYDINSKVCWWLNIIQIYVRCLIVKYTFSYSVNFERKLFICKLKGKFQQHEKMNITGNIITVMDSV